MAKQDILAELSAALTVRAARIRDNVANERLECEALGEEDKDEEPLLPALMSKKQSSQIPVSKARMRYRQMRSKQKHPNVQSIPNSKTGGKAGSNVNIKDYRPGYTWNRGGRAKELRIRCLARKYLFLWQKHTFGSVLLSVARKHYEMGLLEKTFGAWYEYWWVIGKEWRLGVRADCHNRYKLWYRTFLAWKQFVREKKSKTETTNKALNYCDKTAMKRAWLAWREYIKDRQKYSKMVKQAEAMNNLRILGLSWSVWKEKYAQAMSRQDDMTVALQFWGYRIQAQHWLIWKKSYTERKKREERFVEAAIYHNSVTVSKCLKAWVLYAGNRKAKKSHSAFACRVYESNLKLKFFNNWFYNWHLKRSMRQHQMKISALSITFRTRWVLWRWKFYLSLSLEEKEREAIADHHYSLQLMRLGLDSFRLNVVHTHIKRMRIKLADQLRLKQIQQQAWRIWQDAIESQDELKLAPMTHLAREHYRFSTMQKVLSGFQTYACWRRQRKAQYVQAEAHYYLRVMPQCLYHMRMFVDQEKRCREMAIEAQEFSRDCILNRVFHKWLVSANENRDRRMMERMAFLHRESVLLQSTFVLWKARAVAVAEEAERLSEAREYYLRSLCLKALAKWKTFIQDKKLRASNKVMAAKHRYHSVVGSCFRKWKTRFEVQKQEKSLLEKAAKHYSKKMTKLCLSGWKAMVAQGRKFRSVADVKFVVYEQRTLRSAFSGWKEAAKAHTVTRRKSIAARVNYNRNLMKKVTQTWHMYTAMRIYKKSQAQELLQKAVNQLQQLKVSLYFKRWMNAHNSAQAEEEKVLKADRFCRTNLQNKVMAAWKSNSQLCLRKKLMARQGQWFHDVHITAKAYLTWRASLKDMREENQKTHLALWQWSCVLQRKVLQEWRLYTEGRKYKKARYVNAAAAWREKLLRDGCGQWLATADSLGSLRSTMAARQQASSAFSSYHLIQRCAWHWKAWARKRAAGRGVARKRDTALTLTSSVRLTTNVSSHPTLFQTYPTLNHVSKPDILRPQPAAVSPVKPVQGELKHFSLTQAPERRERPKRPSFLVDSLKRAGLYSDAMFSTEADQDPTAGHEDSSTPSLSDLRVPHEEQEYPGTGRFVPHPHQSKLRKMEADWSFTAEVMSGSSSTLGPAESVVKPLHLSNSDTDPSGIRTGSNSTSYSPHMFTPSTQRSQFSGNPLLYSSPVSEKNTSRAGFDTHSGKVSTAVQDYMAGHEESNNPKSNLFGINIENAPLVSGNLEGAGLKTLQKEQNFYQELKPNLVLKSSISGEGDENSKTAESKVVLLTPDDFMKKPPVIPLANSAAGDSRRQVSKRTPRTYSLQEIDQDILKNQNMDFNQDIHRDSLTNPHRHTPRDVFSPRRNAPQGILHNKVSDSDGDASPLNTARSRGTVTFASPKSPSPEEELINIRDRLRHFSQQKVRLRSLKQQYHQLSEWLEEQKANKEDGIDEDTASAAEELDMLQVELDELQGDVDSQRPVCERLVRRAQTLAQELQALAS